MFTISKKDFDALRANHPDYISRAICDHAHGGKICQRGEWCGFESVLTGDASKGTSLIFEHIHFEIV